MSKSIVVENYAPSELPNWEYPSLRVKISELEDKSHIDLSDSVRYQDCFGQPLNYEKVESSELEKWLNEWSGYDINDDLRIFNSYKSGGRTAENPKITSKMRSIAREFVLKVGKHILSGHFNLTTIPFPIKAMVPKSYLEYVGTLPTCHFPLYMNLAAKTSDPLERFKLYILTQIGYFYMTTSFGKPLNPILGETWNAYYDDGTRVYLEQISHHPPIAYELVYGPNDSYKFYGPSQFSASAGLNSLTLNTKAWRKVEFKEPHQVIHNTLPNEYYSGTLLGTTVHETIGSMEFNDYENKIHCKITFGAVKKKASDYIDAPIFVEGKQVSSIKGTYLGWFEFDGKRYFDVRYTKPFHIKHEKSALKSDVNMRDDKALLAIGHYDDAQKEKEALEHVQRTDAKLRKQYKADNGITDNHDKH